MSFPRSIPSGGKPRSRTVSARASLLPGRITQLLTRQPNRQSATIYSLNKGRVDVGDSYREMLYGQPAIIPEGQSVTVVGESEAWGIYYPNNAIYNETLSVIDTDDSGGYLIWSDEDDDDPVATITEVF